VSGEQQPTVNQNQMQPAWRFRDGRVSWTTYVSRLMAQSYDLRWWSAPRAIGGPALLYVLPSVNQKEPT
jgi:hypothetical protein